MGFPSPARDYIEQRIDLDQLLVPRPLSTFYFHCNGESMIEACIPPKSMLIVDRSITATDESIVVCVLNGEFMVRIYKPLGSGCLLLPANQKYKPISVKQESDFYVWGVVTGIISVTKDMRDVRIG